MSINGAATTTPIQIILLEDLVNKAGASAMMVQIDSIILRKTDMA